MARPDIYIIFFLGANHEKIGPGQTWIKTQGGGGSPNDGRLYTDGYATIASIGCILY